MHVCRSVLSLSLSHSLSACPFSFPFHRAIPSSSHSHSLPITSLSFCFRPLLSDSNSIPHPHFPKSQLFHLGFSQISKMVDLSRKGSEAEEANARNPNGASSEENPTMSEQKKTCADCGTSKTPLWRGGPAGPKSLCNACGIKSRKKKRAILGLKGKRSSGGNSNNNNGSSKIGESLKQRLMALGREVLMQRSTAERQGKKLGEEEQAAVLLMALSYGSVYA